MTASDIEQHLNIQAVRQYLSQSPELHMLREACQIVHATANGETYGLTVEERYMALKLAAVHCTEALRLCGEL